MNVRIILNLPTLMDAGLLGTCVLTSRGWARHSEAQPSLGTIGIVSLPFVISSFGFKVMYSSKDQWSPAQ